MSKVFEPANMNLEVPSGQDFNEHVNGTWLKKNGIPGDYSRWGLFEQLGERNNEILKVIMDEAAATAQTGTEMNKKAGNFWSVALNEEKLESDGISPLKPVLEKIDGASDIPSFFNVLAELEVEGLAHLFGIQAEADLTNSSMIICWVDQDGLGLPDRDYYTLDEKEEIRGKYVAYVTAMFQLAGESEEKAKGTAAIVMELETRLANASQTLVERRDPMNLHHPMTITKLIKAAPNVDWKKYFEIAGVETGPVVDAEAEDTGSIINVTNPKFFETLSEMAKDVPLAKWKILAKWHAINGAAPYLSTAFVQTNFDFFGKVLGGQTEMKPRWKRALRWGDDKLGELVGQVYCAKVFTAEAKEAAVAIVRKLQAALRDRIQTVDWMGEETKKKALTKLDSFGVKIGYPDVWIDYSDLHIGIESLLANIRSANAFEHKRQTNRMNKPVDKEKWEMPPQTINAYYHPLRNEICFPAAILQFPMFSPDADPAMNFGAMGAVIGHEMTHGYDDSGRKFDHVGNMIDWWTEEDSSEFERRAKKIVAQFSEYETFGKKVNGELTQGENIADFGGIKIAYLALLKELEEKGDPGLIDGYTQRQRFFLSWAQIWRSNIREQAAHHRIVVDPHSPEKFRVNGTLCQLAEFHEAFGIKEGDPMFLAEDKRMNIW